MRRSSFTLVELLVVIAVVLLLVGMVAPSLSGARESARRTVCLSNFHSISVGAASYLVSENFPAYFDDAITLRGQDYAYSWSDFLVKGRHIAAQVDLAMIPSPSGEGGLPGVYLAGMVSQRDPVFQCRSQKERVWGEAAGVPVSYRADYVITGHEGSLPVGGIYRERRYYQDARLIWMAEAFTTLGGISTSEYVRETQLKLDSNEVNPLRHARGSNYLFGDGHALWSKAFHNADWRALALPWETFP